MGGFGPDLTLESIAEILQIPVSEAAVLLRQVRDSAEASVASEPMKLRKRRAILAIVLPLALVWICAVAAGVVGIERWLRFHSSPVASPVELGKASQPPAGIEVGIDAGTWSETEYGGDAPISLTNLSPSQVEYVQNKVVDSIVSIAQRCPFNASSVEQEGASHFIHVNLRTTGSKWMSFKVPVYPGNFPPKSGNDYVFISNLRQQLGAHWKDLVANEASPN